MGSFVSPLCVLQRHGYLRICIQAVTHSKQPSILRDSSSALEPLDLHTLSTIRYVSYNAWTSRYPCHHPMKEFELPDKGEIPKSADRLSKLETILCSEFNFVLPMPSSSRLVCPFGQPMQDDKIHTMFQYSQDGQAAWYMCQTKGCSAHKRALLSEAEVKALSDLNIYKWPQVQATLILALYDAGRCTLDDGEEEAKFLGAPRDPTSRMKAAIKEVQRRVLDRVALSD